LHEETPSKRAANQSSRKVRSGDGLETWTFPTGYESTSAKAVLSGDDLATKASSDESLRWRVSPEAACLRDNLTAEGEPVVAKYLSVRLVRAA